MKITIEKDIKNCRECPWAKLSKVYTPDPFESVEELYCEMLQEKIYNYLDWYDKTPIPSKCPFIKKEE